MWWTDVPLITKWWGILFLFGLAAFPVTSYLLRSWYDRGYAMSKAVGMAVVAYGLYFFGSLRIIPFEQWSIVAGLLVLFIVSYTLRRISNHAYRLNPLDDSSWSRLGMYIGEEVLFAVCLFSWSWVKGHEPSIRGLEKFMDYGFMQTIMHSTYFPAADMWWAGGTINYYYFGHLTVAVLTKLSAIPLSITFNLMLATIFALCFSMSFSIGIQLWQIGQSVFSLRSRLTVISSTIVSTAVGLTTAFFVSLAGNMQTIYAFTKGYANEETPAGFWTIWRPLSESFAKIADGTHGYWYANATRFIPWTIHEFPSYSFVVSDIHGHVLSIPYVLLLIGVLIEYFIGYANPVTGYEKEKKVPVRKHQSSILESFVAVFGYIHWLHLLFIGFLLAVLLMTNAFDGPIYGLLFGILSLIFFLYRHKKEWSSHLFEFLLPVSFVIFIFGMTSMPFLVNFSSFATGIGINCPPAKLANSKIGPIIFEGVEKCQRSPLWMMWLLWGFFWYVGAGLFFKLIVGSVDQSKKRLLALFYWFSVLLIIIPEFVYAKDIYPQHFRSNTMFKLGYQAFILWSIVGVQVLFHMVASHARGWGDKLKQTAFSLPARFVTIVFFILLVPQIFLVSIFPLFSVKSYFGDIWGEYRGLEGLTWYKTEYSDEYAGMVWVRDQVEKEKKAGAQQLPVIVEADGESYTDSNAVSAFAGTPTVVGWAVHEWLWRGSYDIVAPRREEVRKVYEATTSEDLERVLSTFHIRYIIISSFERKKYPLLNETLISSVATPVFLRGTMRIYEYHAAK
jgi:YYY domain-containing protein